jgi:conjugal transfer pilus assembly protein TraW
MPIMHRIHSSILCVTLSLIITQAHAKSLGCEGEVYPIAELDLLQLIQENVAAQSKTFQAQWNKNNYDRMDRPPRVDGLSRTEHSRVFFFDPTVTLSDNQTVNPLDMVSLKQPLIFYDADDRNQVRWVQQMDQALKGNDKLILIGGSVLSQMQLFHKPIYFDQSGLITARFGLHHIPTLITQEGKYLKIQEINLS